MGPACRFGTFEFDPATGELRRAGRDVRLEPQPARALALLVAKPGDVVTREALKAALWGSDTHVDFDRGLAYCIGQVRTALGDSAENPRFVETLPKRGFRFIAPVETFERTDPAAVLARQGYGADVAPAAEAAGLRLSELPGLKTRPPSDPGGFCKTMEPPARAVRIPKRVSWGVAALVVVALGLTALMAFYVNSRPVLAIAKFDNETGDAAHDRFTSSIADALIARLGTDIDPTRLGVIGNAAVLRIPRSERDLRAIEDATGATYVLVAQLQKADAGLRVITHLIRMSDGVHVDTQRFNRPAGDTSGLEDEVGRALVSALQAKVLR